MNSAIRAVVLMLALLQPLGLYAASELELHFVYVGQGDCTFVKTPEGSNVLIDCGSTRDGDPIEARNYVQQVIGAGGKIDVLVVTHPDADHYNYLRGALQGITVDKVLYVGDSSEYPQDSFDGWLSSHANAVALTPSDASSPTTPVPTSALARRSSMSWRPTSTPRAAKRTLAASYCS